MLIRGRCHCGNIAFALAWEPDPAEIQARACSCSFCVKHGGVWTSNPNGALQVVVKDAALVSRYAFGTRTAEFHKYKLMETLGLQNNSELTRFAIKHGIVSA